MKEREPSDQILNKDWEAIHLNEQTDNSRLIETFWLDGYVPQDDVFHAGENTLSYFEALLDTGRARQELRHTDSDTDEYDIVLNEPDIPVEPAMDPWDDKEYTDGI